jgi:hypothetical protein
MRKNIYLITVLIAIVIIYLCFFRKEMFVNPDPLAGGHLQDRVNPLVANTRFDNVDTTGNPNLVKVGIPVAEADALRQMSITGLNKPDQYHTLAGGITTTQPFADYDMSLPIFDETSMLAMDNFCKSYDVSTNPFTDPNSKFSKNCGVCFGDGTPKGVLLYEKDKELAIVNKQARNYKYPRAMPSLGRSTCTGATSQTNDSAPPTLAINSDMYNDINNRNKCLKTPNFTNNCGNCVTNNSVWSYVKSDPGVNMAALKLYLVGSGKITVTVKGVNKASDVLLSSKPIIELGPITEGETFTITVKQDGVNTAQIGGALEGTVPTGGKYLRDLFDIVKDKTFATATPRTVGRTPLSSYIPNPNITVKTILKRNRVQQAGGNDGSVSCEMYCQGFQKGPWNGLLPVDFYGARCVGTSGTSGVAPECGNLPNPKVPINCMCEETGQGWANTGGSGNPYERSSVPADIVKIRLEATIPLTFIDAAQNQMAFYDCKNGPYITKQSSAELLGSIDDCIGQPTSDGYTDECKRKKLLEAGCSSAGTWWSNPGQITQKTGLDAWISSQKANAKTDLAASMGCYGVDISTPCDSSPGSRECLAYTYASSQE